MNSSIKLIYVPEFCVIAALSYFIRTLAREICKRPAKLIHLRMPYARHLHLCTQPWHLKKCGRTNPTRSDTESICTCFQGQVKVEFNKTNHTVEVGGEISIPSNDTHVVYTVSETPSCWMYIFTNTTEWNNETLRNWILHPGKLLSRLGKIFNFPDHSSLLLIFHFFFLRQKRLLPSRRKWLSKT